MTGKRSPPARRAEKEAPGAGTGLNRIQKSQGKEWFYRPRRNPAGPERPVGKSDPAAHPALPGPHAALPNAEGEHFPLRHGASDRHSPGTGPGVIQSLPPLF